VLNPHFSSLKTILTYFRNHEHHHLLLGEVTIGDINTFQAQEGSSCEGTAPPWRLARGEKPTW